MLRAHTGQPDEFCVWLVCRTRVEQREFRDTDLARFNSGLRRRMLATGFSEGAVAALEVRVTSREEMPAGRFPAFH